MLKAFLISLLTILIYSNANLQAQDIGSWTATTSLISVNDMVYDNDGNVWGITDGGLFRWNETAGFEYITPINGLYRLRPSAVTYDQNTGFIWLGYSDGNLQSFDPETYLFRSMGDILRNQNFASRGINRLQFVDGVLFAATNFGMVLINADRRIVIDSYVNLGRFERATTVLDFVVDGDMIYLATTSGVAVANRSTGNLIEPGAWDNSDGQGALGTLTARINAISRFRDILYVATPNGNLRLSGQAWQSAGELGPTATAFRMSVEGSMLASISNNAVRIMFQDGTNQAFPRSTGAQYRSALVVDTDLNTKLFAGTRSAGIVAFAPINSEERIIRPAGPELNFFTDIIIQNGDIVSASTRAPGRFGVNLDFSGYFIQRDGAWVGFDRSNHPVLQQANFNSTHVSAITNDHYFFGTWGRGIAMHNKQTDSIFVWNAENSPLQAVLSSNTFVVVSGLDSDAQGNLWVTTYQSPGTGLYKFTPSVQEWEAFAYPSQVPGGTFFINVMVDRFGQIWSGLVDANETGRGLLVWDTSIPEGPQAIRLTSSQTEGNLPDERVNVIVQDRRGEVWIGTNRGVARFLFPDRVIRGSALDRQASFLINADTSAASPFLLRDVHVTAMAVNAANQKWIGTLNDGLWLIDEPGRNVLRHFTTENSPLFSNNITGLAVNNETGEVYIATSEGLLTYTDVVKRENRTMESLTVYPNPLVYSRHNGSVFIEGLTESTTVSIVSVDGRLIRRFDSRGGRVEWDGRDFSGNLLSSGVYLIIANDVNGNERGIGRIAVIR